MNSENDTVFSNSSEQQQTAVNQVPLLISEEIKSNLHLTGKWGMFLAILGFIFTALIVFAGFIMSIIFSFIPSAEMSPFPFPPILFGLVYLIIGALYFFPVWYLYRFSADIKKSLRTNDQQTMAKAFHFLKAHYRFIGIMIIVSLILYFIVLAVLMFAGLLGGLGGLSAFPGTSV